MLLRPLDSLLRASFSLPLALHLLLLGSLPQLGEMILHSHNSYPHSFFLRPLSELIVPIDLRLFEMLLRPLDSLLRASLSLLLELHLLLLGSLPQLGGTSLPNANYYFHSVLLKPCSGLLVSTGLQLFEMLLLTLGKLLRALFFLLLVLHLPLPDNLPQLGGTSLPNANCHLHCLFLRLWSGLLVFPDLRLFEMLLRPLDSLLQAVFSLFFLLQSLLLDSLLLLEEIYLLNPNFYLHSFFPLHKL